MYSTIRGNGYATEFRADSKGCLHYRLLSTCKAFTIGYLLSIFVIYKRLTSQYLFRADISYVSGCNNCTRKHCKNTQFSEDFISLLLLISTVFSSVKELNMIWALFSSCKGQGSQLVTETCLREFTETTEGASASRSCFSNTREYSEGKWRQNVRQKDDFSVGDTGNLVKWP